MPNIKEEYKQLATLATFRELCNSKKDIYDVIKEFLHEIIIHHALCDFNLTEISQLLNAENGFDLPEAVIHTSIKRLAYISKDQKFHYIVDRNNLSKSSNLSQVRQKAEKCNNLILEALFKYIKETKNIEINEEEKDQILKSLFSFLMDKNIEDHYVEYISSFILTRQDDDFLKELNCIREGLIVYSGIKYNQTLSDLGSWKSKLTIFLDTELLFHFAGYNGELYKELFLDFLNYVREINSKNHAPLIKLRYFKEITKEIKSFFSKARQIIDGKDVLHPDNTAMSIILKGISRDSQAVEKEADFFHFLSKNNIIEDETQDYYKSDDMEHNIIDPSTIEKLNRKYNFETFEHLNFLNYVHIKRKNQNNNNFHNIKYILLTGNWRTISLAWDESIKTNGSVPLATTLFWLTNKFWFKLNKGFGNSSQPKSFNVIVKAQIVLSSLLNESISDGFHELVSKQETEKLSKEQIQARIVHLRSQAKRPEEITSDDLSSILGTINENTLEKFKREQDFQKIEIIEQKESNIKLTKALSQQNEVLKKSEEEKKILTSQLINTKNQLLADKVRIINQIEAQKAPIDFIINRSCNLFKALSIIIFIAYYAVVYYLIWKYGWNKLEQYIWILGTIPFIIAIIYMIITEKTINPLKLLKNKKRKIQDKKYSQFKIDIILYKSLIKEKDEIENEIEELKRNS